MTTVRSLRKKQPLLEGRGDPVWGGPAETGLVWGVYHPIFWDAVGCQAVLSWGCEGEWGGKLVTQPFPSSKTRLAETLRGVNSRRGLEKRTKMSTGHKTRVYKTRRFEYGIQVHRSGQRAIDLTSLLGDQAYKSMVNKRKFLIRFI